MDEEKRKVFKEKIQEIKKNRSDTILASMTPIEIALTETRDDNTPFFISRKDYITLGTLRSKLNITEAQLESFLREENIAIENKNNQDNNNPFAQNMQFR